MKIAFSPALAALKGHRFLVFAAVCGLPSIVITFADRTSNWRWLALNLWLVALVAAFVGLARPLNLERLKAAHFTRLELLGLVALALVAIVPRFLFLNIYPFTPINDGFRDAGLEAARIAGGENTTIFDYDYDDAHNFVIPALISYLYRLFGDNVLIYRVPSALVGIAGILLLYFTVRKFAGKPVAFWAALVAASLPLHLYYSRTELVVILSSFWTSASLYALGNLLQERSPRNFGLVGLVTGIALGLHAAVRTVALLTLGLAFLIAVYYFWKKFDRKLIGQGLGLFLLLLVIGFGPRLVYSPPDVIFQTSKLTLLETPPDATAEVASSGIWNKVVNTLENYPRSLMVFISERTTSHYHDHRPILNFVYSIFFVVGLVLALWQGSAWLRLVALFALVIPFTNSAITNAVNADHRLTPLLPVSGILVAYGLVEIIKKLSQPGLFFRLAQFGVAAAVLITATLTIYWFFDNEQASYSMYRQEDSKVYKDYLLTYSIQAVKADPALLKAPALCYRVSPDNLEYFDRLHIREQFEFFLPKTQINLRGDPTLPNNVFQVGLTCNPELLDQPWQKLDYCAVWQKFVCTPNRTTFELYKRPA